MIILAPILLGEQEENPLSYGALGLSLIRPARQALHYANVTK